MRATLNRPPPEQLVLYEKDPKGGGLMRTNIPSFRLPEAVLDEEVERISMFVASYCDSELAARIATLAGAEPERPFAFEHDGVLLRGRLDVLWREGTRALVLDYKTNTLAEGTPEEIVEADYRLQRLVYALACFRAGASHAACRGAYADGCADAGDQAKTRKSRRSNADGHRTEHLLLLVPRIYTVQELVVAWCDHE